MGILNSKTARQESMPDISQYIRKIEELENKVKVLRIPSLPLSMTNIDYENIIFEGGGVKGLAFCGAIKELERCGITRNLRQYGGSSAGAITATLMAIGLTADEIYNISMGIDYETFLDDKFGYIRDSYKLLTDYGICSGKCFYDTMGTIIKNKTGDADYTFGQLYAEKDKILAITGTDLTNMVTQYYHHKVCPNMPIREAIRISMSIPYLFVPMEADECFLVDGGTINNYPIKMFDGNVIGESQLAPPNIKTIGLKIMTPDEVVSYKINTNKNQINSIKDFTLALVNTLQMANERAHMTEENWERTIPIKLPFNLPITKFSLSEKEKAQLYECGRHCVYNYFNE
jgi:NTE family protein